jgi:hypothetical protein
VRNRHCESLFDAFEPGIERALWCSGNLLEEIAPERVLRAWRHTIRLAHELRNNMEIPNLRKKISNDSKFLVCVDLFQMCLGKPVRILVVGCIRSRQDRLTTTRDLLLTGRYEHWRPNAGWQTEEHFSDGTLRLLGLLWALLEGNAPLLLEEPELSLHAAVVRYIPSMMNRAGRKSSRQVLISTHSADLLSDEGIAPEEVVLLEPSGDGTRAVVAVQNQQVRALVEGGLTIGDAVLPLTAPRAASQLALFGE